MCMNEVGIYCDFVQLFESASLNFDMALMIRYIWICYYYEEKTSSFLIDTI